ncbi:MAG: adenosylcobinamide-GDP ribazoletransferase [Deltaproteobacteria bacterium]|nr:adenosylcobinamide-GDP ribazoletransferase [Deltaproteobacteria bacterium]
MNPVKSFLAALGFLTRLPVGHGASPAVLGRAGVFFPLAGLLMGAVTAGAAWLGADHVPPLLLAASLAGLHSLLSGGLHLDGLADCFDALGARIPGVEPRKAENQMAGNPVAGNPEAAKPELRPQGAPHPPGLRPDQLARLEIMRDSRIGTYGAAALVWVVLAKTAALYSLLEGNPLPATGGIAPDNLVIAQAGFVIPLLLFPVAARVAPVMLLAWLPNPRPFGLGRVFQDHMGRMDPWCSAGVALFATAGIGVLAGLEWLEPAAKIWPSFLAAVGVGLAVGWIWKDRLGGVTGDVCGAAIELGELAFLTVWVSRMAAG